MKLNKLDKKIIKFCYPLQLKPGFTKKKSLLHYLDIDETELDLSLDRLILHRYLESTKKKTSHQGACFELTEVGLRAVNELNKPLFATIKERPIISSMIALLVYLFTYFMDLFKPEIKGVLIDLFDRGH